MEASEDRLDAFFLLQDAFALADELAGGGELVEWLGEVPPEPVVPDATGGYGHPAAAAIVAAGLALAIVASRQGQAFAGATGWLAGTDRMDAFVLVRCAGAVPFGGLLTS